MRSFPALIAMVALLGSATRSQTTAASALALRPDQVPTDCSMVGGSFPVDIQTAILWEKPDLYKTVIPPPIAKNAHSFACQGDKGTVYSFQFSDAPKRKTAAAFIKPLLWGESGPSAEHPELVLEAGDVLRVITFQKTPKALLAALTGSSAPIPENAGTNASSGFFIPQHGSLQLKVPDGWQSQSHSLTDPPSVILHFSPANGDAFDLQVTAVWLEPDRRSRETPGSLKATVQRAANALLPHSLEKTATIHDLRGPESAGFYYALTDNNPGPGEFSYLTQGVFLTREVLSTFTILHRAPASSEANQALRAFSEATYTQ